MLKKYFILLLLSFKVAATDITPAMTGSWFEEDNPGQGLNLEILGSDRFIVYWYAYDQGLPIWLVGAGNYKGDTATAKLGQFKGNGFGTQFDHNTVSNSTFGSMTLTFDSCDTARVSYESTQAGSGVIQLSRLTSIPGLSCTESAVNTGAQRRLNINPVREGWYDAQTVDVEAVTQSAASTLLEHMPAGLKLAPIILKNDEDGPVVLFRRGERNEYIVLVDIEGLKWAQLAYQFSHELCHILSNYESTKKDANQWFEEALCEGTSIHAVKQMSDVWKTSPPYPAWQSYSAALEEYYKDILAEQHRYLPAGDNIADWYQREKVSLRSSAEQRDKNEVIGTKIYAFFEQKPDRWQSMRYINIGNANEQITLQQYLQDWRDNLPADLKYVAETISGWFGY